MYDVCVCVLCSRMVYCIENWTYMQYDLSRSVFRFILSRTHSLILHVSHATMKLKLKLEELNKCFNDCCLLWNVVRNILMWTTFSRRRVCQLFTWKCNWIVLVLKKNNIRKFTLAVQIMCDREHDCDCEWDCDCDCNWNCKGTKYKMNTLNSIQPRKWTVF